MIQPIVRDVMFLSCKSQAATAEDLPVAHDLADPRHRRGPASFG